MNPIWQKMRIERDGSIAPVHQIANSIRHAIATSRLIPGETLPSVRQLAAQLEVTPATVGRGYALLQDEGLLTARTGSSTVVAGLADIENAALKRSGEAAGEVIAKTIETLTGMGLKYEDIRTIFNQKLNTLADNRYVVFVAGSTPVVDKYRNILESQVRPLGFKVVACRLAEFQKPTAELERILDRAVHLVCMLSFKRGIDAALEESRRQLPVSLLLTEISTDSSAALAAIDPNRQVLVVAEPEYRNVTAGLIRNYIPEDQVRVASSTDPVSLRKAIGATDVVVYTLGCVDLFKAAAPASTESLLLEYNARSDSLARIKAALLTV